MGRQTCLIGSRTRVVAWHGMEWNAVFSKYGVEMSWDRERYTYICM